MLITRRGLGAVNPFITQAANTTLVQSGGGGGESSHAGGFSLTPHTWQEVVIESNPIRGMNAAQWEAALAAWRGQVAAAAAPLGACDPAAVTDGGTTCYYGRFTPIVSWNPLDPVDLLPPGVFAVYGVPFGAYEIKGGTFTRTAAPTSRQRRDLEWAVIHASQIRLFGHPNRQTRIDQRFLDDGLIAQTLTQQRTSLAVLPKLSVDQLVELVPDVMLFSINFERNAVQPTPSERTGDGGFYAWIARGGYPLSRAVVTGRAPTSSPIGLQFCAGFECACPSSGGLAGFPSCVPMGFTKDGIGTDPNPNSGEGAFYPYVTIPQDRVRSDVQLSLVHADPAWVSKVGVVGEKVLREVFNALCANQGFTKEKLTAMVQERCVDAAGKVCLKGSPGCVCTTPSSTQQAAVGLFNGAMQIGCNSWLSDGLPDPMTNLPPVAPPPASPALPWYARIPWWIVSSAGLIAGAAAFSRRST